MSEKDTEQSYRDEHSRRRADEVRLIRRISNMNPIAGEIGNGLLRQIVDDARRITSEWDSERITTCTTPETKENV